MLPWQPHRTRERLEPRVAGVGAGGDGAGGDLSDVAVLIPARNEVDVIGRTLTAVLRQGRGLAVIVVDDQSTDDTAAVCSRFGPAVRVVSGAPLPSGWAGKLWALEQGAAAVDRPYVLLLDADIELADGMLPALRAELVARNALLVSIMAELRCRSFWERLLVPPFVFFFKLLYPFALANDPRSRVSAAAGGCMLLRTDALRAIGGFGAIRGALIDDCTLAAKLKPQGPTWLGLSHGVRSHRAYDFAALFRMVSRSAFTQLRYSTVLLLAVTAAMLVFFVAPLVALAGSGAWLGAGAWLAMSLAYVPVVRFYGLPLPWVLTLPAAGVLFLAMTWDSALGYWRGTRATWKGRAYDAAR